jgi:hypothetical protein
VTSEDVAAFEPKRRPLWFKLFIGLCIVTLAFTAWLFLERKRGQSALKKYEQQLIAKGEKLTFAEVVSTPGIKSRDGAIELVASSSRLQPGGLQIANSPPAMKSIASGKVLVISKETGWMETGKKVIAWEHVAKGLNTNRAVLDEIRALVRRPQLSYPINYRGFSTLLPHLGPIKRAAQWFSASSLYNLRGGNAETAIDDIETILWLARVLEDEPIMISQLVRISIVALAIHDCWQLLQHDDISEPQLLRLQGLFNTIDFASGMIRAVEIERAMGSDTIQSMRTGELSFSALTGSGGLFQLDDDVSPALKKVPYGEELQEGIRAVLLYPTWRFALSYNDDLRLLQETQHIIESMRSSKTNRSAAVLRATATSLDTRLRGDLKSWRYLATCLLLPPLEPATMRSFRAQTHWEIAKAAIALERYHLQHQRYPAALAQLVPAFLPETPIDYIDGSPLRYRVEERGFALWSIGSNAKDEAGTPAARPLSWTSPEGKDTVWPQPASDAEVAEYRESIKR